jgi:hypothetical protein
MAIVTSSYRPKRAPRKKRPRGYPADMQTIVTSSGPKKQLKGPVIRLNEQQQTNDNGQEQPQPRHSAIVEPKRSTVHDDYESRQWRGDGRPPSDRLRPNAATMDRVTRRKPGNR